MRSSAVRVPTVGWNSCTFDPAFRNASSRLVYGPPFSSSLMNRAYLATLSLAAENRASWWSPLAIIRDAGFFISGPVMVPCISSFSTTSFALRGVIRTPATDAAPLPIPSKSSTYSLILPVLGSFKAILTPFSAPLKTYPSGMLILSSSLNAVSFRSSII